MKQIIVYLVAFMLIFFPSYVKAGEEARTTPIQEMIQLLQCKAVNVSLSSLHEQVAASLQALSGPVGKEKLFEMIKGYNALAKAEQGKIDDLTEVANQVIIPQLLEAGISKEEIEAKNEEIFKKILMDILGNVSNPSRSFVEKVAMEQILVKKSDECDTRFAKLLRQYTY